MTAKERDAALAAGAMAYLLSDWVCKIDLICLQPTLIDASQERDAASAARALRQHWKLGEQPIADMIRLLEAEGRAGILPRREHSERRCILMLAR